MAYKQHHNTLISVIVPVYNEAATIRELLRRVARVPIRKEIIVVDDGSTDGTAEILRRIQDHPNSVPGDQLPAPCHLRVLYHHHNQGNGAAIRTALSVVTGEIVLIQDADLEYDPAEYTSLIQPIIEDRADVVYGSRFLGHPHRVLLFWHMVGNRLLTLLSNMFTNLNLTDMETGYKAFRTRVLWRIRLQANRFGFEPEVTAKISRQGLRIYEVPISYAGRTYAEGKKINWMDGVAALWAILRYNLIDDMSYSGEKTLRRASRLSRYNAWLWEQIAPFTAQRILEVGSGIGTMTRFFLGREFVLATDIEPQYLERLRIKFGRFSHVKVQPLNLNQPIPEWLPSYQVDTVVCLNVLEHIEDDRGALSQFFHLLPSGGRVVLLVPALKGIYGAIDKAIGHFRRYEKKEITGKLIEAGFAVEEARFINMIGVPGWYVNSCLLKRKEIPGLQARLSNKLVPLLQLEKQLTPPWGMSLLAVGRKA